MKKLVALIGAVAMGFGLFANESVSFSTSFEAGEAGVSDATFTPGEGWAWEGDPLALGAYADDAYEYGTGDLARRFDGTQEKYLQLETGDKTLLRDLGVGNTTVDQLVKFTGYDAPLTEFAADAKIAVWMLGTENTDDTPGETNLYVTCGAAKDALKLVAPAGTTWQTEKWYRLTVKSLGTDATGREQFNIYIDGQLIGAEGQDTQTVFPSMSENEPVTKMKIQGIGAIDDLTIDADGPLFTQSVEFTVELPANVASATVTGAEQTATGWKAKNGAAIAITYTAADGYLFNNKQSTITVNTTAAKGVIAATDDVKSATEAKAKIGTTIYLTLQDAFNAAVDGDTVQLVANIADAQALLENAVAITLDLNGKTICCATPKDANNWYGYTIRVNAGRLTIVDKVGGGQVINNNDDSAVRCCAPTGGEAACPKVIIKSGTFVNNSTESGTIYVGPTSGAVIEIRGGTFQNQATFVYGNASGVINVGNDMANKETAIIVTGGTFSLDPAFGDDKVAVSYVAQGYASTETDGWWTVARIPVADFAKVTVNEEVTYYNDLAAALEAGKGVGSLVELTNDVDLAGIDWTPIPSFAGTFDGKGYKICNLTVDTTTSAGLFGKISDPKAVVRNFTIENASVTGDRAGVIAGEGGSPGCVVSNITVCGAISVVGNEYVAALIGHGGYVQVSNCHVDGGTKGGTVTAKAKVGGIFGMTGEQSAVACDCTVKNLTITATDPTDSKAGALMGRQHWGVMMINCSAENVVVKGDKDTVGAYVGRFETKDVDPSWIINSSVKNVALQTVAGEPRADNDYGDLTTQNVIIGTGVEGDLTAAAGHANKLALTAGTFKLYNANGLTADKLGLIAACAKGYKPVLVAGTTDTYMIEEILVESVTLDVTEKTLEPEATLTLTATVTPADALNKGIAWTTSAEAVATVVDGEVTAVAEGTATITATNAASGVFATCTVTVKSAGIKPGETKQLAEGSTTPEAAQELASKIPVVLSDADKAAGLSASVLYTKAQLVGGAWQAVVEVKPEFAPEIETTAEEPITVGATDFTAKIENVQPGLYYGFKAVDALGTNAEFQPVGTFQRATESGELTVTAPKGSGNARFFKLTVSVTDLTPKTE